MLSAKDVARSKLWAATSKFIVLHHIDNCSLALSSILAAGEMVLTISPVVVRHMCLAEHSAASIPERWAQCSVIGIHELVLSVTVAVSTIVASLFIAGGVWDSNTFLGA